jgi:hypothetical protein
MKKESFIECWSIIMLNKEDETDKTSVVSENQVMSQTTSEPVVQKSKGAA